MRPCLAASLQLGNPEWEERATDVFMTVSSTANDDSFVFPVWTLHRLPLAQVLPVVPSELGLTTLMRSTHLLARIICGKDRKKS